MKRTDKQSIGTRAELWQYSAECLYTDTENVLSESAVDLSIIGV